MNIIDIANSIDKTKIQNEDTINWEYILQLFDISGYYYNLDEQNTRLKCYWIDCWYCTDSWVGKRAYFLDGELVCISQQDGRKCEENFQFVSKEMTDELEKYILSIIPKEDKKYPLIDRDENVSDYYTIEFSCQAIARFHKFGLLTSENKHVEIIEVWDNCNDFHKVKYLIDGKEKIGDIRQIAFKRGQSFDAGGIKYNR